MRDYIAAFIGCFVIVLVGTFFLGGFILSNIWGLIIFFTLLLTVFVTVFGNSKLELKF